MTKRDSHKKIDREIRKWMSLYASEYSTATEAAENCAWGLDHDEWLDDELHPVWEIALEWVDEE